MRLVIISNLFSVDLTITFTKNVKPILQAHPSKDVQKNILEALDLNKIKSATDGSIITWIKFPEQNFLGTATAKYF